MTVVLQASDLTKVYGKGDNAFTALDGVTLAIKQGESVAIIGKSGSGKSTLMHLLALMDKPTSGAVRVKDAAVNEMGARHLAQLRNRSFGFVFQQFFLNAHASVLDNVVLPLKIAGVSSRERRRRAAEVLAAVEMTDKAASRASDLSGGQKQRVVIARALINDPQIIFADEPTGNLDSATGANIENMLFSLNKQKDITLIVVTHDEDLARRCDRQLFIKDGHLTEAMA